jgi:hypothetical protein
MLTLYTHVDLASCLGFLSSQRLAACSSKGFTAVLLDDVDDTWDTPNGFNLTLSDYQNFTSWLANQTVATYGMRAGIMGGSNMWTGDAAWAAQFHFAAAVGCFASGTCDAWSPFKQGRVQAVHAFPPATILHATCCAAGMLLLVAWERCGGNAPMHQLQLSCHPESALMATLPIDVDTSGCQRAWETIT